MGLINQNYRIGAKQWVGLQLHEQDAVGHHLDAGIGICSILKPHLVADKPIILADLPPDEITDAECCNASGLRNAYLQLVCIAGFMEDQGDLRSLSASGWTFNNDDLVFCKSIKNFLPMQIHRQMFHVFQINSFVVWATPLVVSDLDDFPGSPGFSR